MIRFQMDISETEAAMIDAVGQLTDATTKRQVIMDAMSLYRWAANHAAMGCDILAVSGDHRSQITTPGLDVAREKTKQTREG